MKPKHRQFTRARHFYILGMLLVVGILVDEQIAFAQSVIGNQAPTVPLTTEWQQNQSDEMEVFTPSGRATDNSLPQIFRYGPLMLRPHLDYRFTYGDGIQATPGSPTATALNQVSPGILINLGTHWAIDYTPTFMVYSSSQFRNVVDQAVALTGNVLLEEWKFDLSHTSQFTTDPLAQTGSQTEQSTHQTEVTATHAFTPQISADFGLSQNINLVSGYQDSFDWSTLDWLNYQFWPRLTAGLGAGIGYDKINNKSPFQIRNQADLDQTYEQLQARISWRATDKFSFQINGGMDARQFKSPGSSTQLDPIYGATIQYEPFKTTQISLNANRSVGSSDYYLAAQTEETTSISLNLNQTLLRKFTLGMSVGFTRTDYVNVSASTVVANALDRNDDIVSFNVRLSHPFFKRGTWSVFYQYSDDKSSQSRFSYQSNQTGFEISYSY